MKRPMPVHAAKKVSFNFCKKSSTWVAFRLRAERGVSKEGFEMTTPGIQHMDTSWIIAWTKAKRAHAI
jgi:hypothetical protein